MWNEGVPLIERKVRRSGTQTGNEVILPSLDCSFSGEGSVHARRGKLDVNVVVVEELDEVLRRFVVELGESGI